ncbi:MAG TPA: thiol:disulfide interchange protein DsbA/DsbL [Steroidobacteraceae bacterium]|nr:thiol:disulfide interchange protein DsbA/DsbL [Steroidobacteraceae bacterium]
MTRTPSLPIVITLSATALLALSACSRQSQAPQPAAQSAAQSAPTTAASPASPADSGQQTAGGQSASGPTPSSSATSTPSADTSSPSLEHLAALPASAALPTSSDWKPGVNYDVITPAQPTTVAPGKVEVLEVFWLACPHCYALEPYIQQWLKTKPSYVEFVRVPVMWGPVQHAHARLYYTLQALGRDDLFEKAFTYIHNVDMQSNTESGLVADDKDQTFKEQQAWAVQNGINADAFAQAYNSFFVNTQLQQAEETMNDYQVQQVPFIAVDGRFGTGVEKAGGPNKLISLVNFLSAWEHDHKQE